MNIDKEDALGIVDFSAPGISVYSSYLDNSYEVMSGTSMAAPHVTGVLALMIADYRNDIDKDGIVSSKEIMNVLYKRAQDLGSVGYDLSYGYGVLVATN